MRPKGDRKIRGWLPTVASIRKAVRASHYGLKDYRGYEANELIAQYSERKRLAGLGVTISGDEIPAFICDAFLVIERTIDDIKDEEDKKRKAKSSARKR